MSTVNASPIAPDLTPTITPTSPPALSLDEMHLALSHIVCRREYRHPSPPKIPSHPDASPDNKHLELLNLLSLLLVTGSAGDVAAAMFRVLSKDRLELHYAKNRPCTNKEKAYIRSIFDIVSREERRDCHLLCWDILAQVIPDCKRKIMSRMKKVCLRLKELSPSLATTGSASFAICEGGCTTETDEMLHQALGQGTFSSTGTVPQLLRAWFNHLLKMPDEGSAVWDIGSVHHTIRLAFYIGHAPQMEQFLDAQLLRRVRKLGDYYGAALVLIRNAELLPRDQLRQLRIVEAVPLTPDLRLLRTNQVDTINKWARHVGEPEVSEADLRIAFPEMDNIPSNPASMHTVCVHCECTLLLKMIRITSTAASPSAPTPMLLQMGVSKSSCFMCREFITAVQTVYRHITVLVSSCHGKHVAGWSLPKSAPAVLRDLMEKRIMDEMDDILQRATRKRKSDSIPRPNAPGLGGLEGMPSADQLAEQLRSSGAHTFSLAGE